MTIEENGFHDIVHVEIVGNYLLRLTFDDKTQQTIDFEPLLYGPVFAPLRDLEQFNQVTLNQDTGTIEWPSGADFNPTMLHDWPQHRERVIAEKKQRYIVSAA